MPPGISTVLPRQVQSSGDTQQSQRTTPDPTPANPVRTTDQFLPRGGFASINGSNLDIDTNLDKAGVRIVEAAVRAAQATQGRTADPNIATAEVSSAVADIRRAIVQSDLDSPLTTVRDGGVNQGLNNIGSRFNPFAATVASVQGGARAGNVAVSQSITNVIQALSENPEQFLQSIVERSPSLQGNTDLANAEFKKQVLSYLSLITPSLTQLKQSLEFGIKSSAELGKESKGELEKLTFSGKGGGGQQG